MPEQMEKALLTVASGQSSAGDAAWMHDVPARTLFS